MSRFYVPKDAVRGNEIVVEGPEAHHILDVMRLGKGDPVSAFDGSGKEYQGTIVEAGAKGLKIQISRVREISAEAGPSVTLAQSVPKKDRMDTIVEKATELGVGAILPVQTERTIVRLTGERAASRVERWRKLAREAAKQCGRVTLPTIDGITDIGGALEKSKGSGLIIMACLAKGTEDIRAVLGERTPESVFIFVGPEGDFTGDEIEQARSCGARLVSLGARVLKSDTAGLAILAMVDYEYGHRS